MENSSAWLPVSAGTAQWGTEEAPRVPPAVPSVEVIPGREIPTVEAFITGQK